MSANNSIPEGRRLRLLVAIASYGLSHLEILKKLIRQYQAMDMDVDVVVLSEAPKELGPGVEVVVGLPSKNPYSLPFAHKAVFAERADQYDLFIYSEDDNDVHEGHIRAFVNATAHLGPDEIAGFLRYEIYPSGEWFMDEVFEHFHWRPGSVAQRGPYTIAEFTNEHAGFFILSQSQLKRAIASGGFLRAPYEGVYCIRETAATDPYTSCGFRKVICISCLEDFLIHHADNRYVGWHCMSLVRFKEQIRTLMKIHDGSHPATTLFDIEPKFWHSLWQKGYYERPGKELLNMVPREAKRVLSIGCGWGAAEAELKQRGAEVTALPLDSVIGPVAAEHGIQVIHGAWKELSGSLNGRRFDCVLVTNLIHLQPDAGVFLAECARFVDQSGVLVLSGPNFQRLPLLAKRLLAQDDFRKLGDFDLSGINGCGPGSLAAAMKQESLQITGLAWLEHGLNRGFLRGKTLPLGRLTARNWILQARRKN
jgi:2-polyprenyl-3-methyl-5-hydroxy-6-metoxy-1,4-benzoquinol methylase